MINVLFITGVGCIITSSLGIIRVLYKSKRQHKDEVLELPPGKDEDLVIPEVFKTAIKENPDLEKKFTELTIEYDILKAKLNQYEDEDMHIQDEVKKLMKKDRKSSKLVDEIFSK